MDFDLSPRAQEVCDQLWDFMREQVFPAEPVYDEWRAAPRRDDHQHPPGLEGLEEGARQRGVVHLLSHQLRGGSPHP